MNHRGGWALIRHTWLSWMQHRSFFFLLAFGWMIPPLIYLFVWSTAAGRETVGGLTRGEFVAYYLILVVVNQLTYAQTNWTVGDLIREGSMSRLLLYPMSPIYNTLATELAGKVVYMIFVIPVTLLLALFLRPELHTSPFQIVAFIPALGLAWLLRFFWGYWLALLAFWVTRADSLLAMQDALIFLVGGQVAPIVLLPGVIQSAAIALPFRYMVGFPVEVLTGQVTGIDLITGFVLQSGWLLLHSFYTQFYGGVALAIMLRWEDNMVRHLRLIRVFIEASSQQQVAYRTNFLISVLHSLLNFGTGVLGLVVLFEQVEAVRGWSFPATLAVLGVYLIVGALRDLFISPSLDALAGMDGEVWQGTLDFTLLRPVDIQFLASFRHWRPFALLDLLLGLGVLVTAAVKLGNTPTSGHLLTFLVTLGAGVSVLYAILLAFTGLVFWSPGFLFTWVFSGIFQMARYPVGLYPGGLRLLLTWIVPVGVITTIPAQALTGDLSLGRLSGTLVFALALVVGASYLFRGGLRRYASASS